MSLGTGITTSSGNTTSDASDVDRAFASLLWALTMPLELPPAPEGGIELGEHANRPRSFAAMSFPTLHQPYGTFEVSITIRDNIRPLFFNECR
jgi:hypothetical protein